MAGVNSLNADKEILTDDHRFAVITALQPLASRWRTIGTALGLSSDTLEAISAQHGNEIVVAISAVVSRWMAKTHNVNMFGDICWDTVVKAVAHPAGGGDQRIAEEIAKQHPGEEMMMVMSSPLLPPPSRSGSVTSQENPNALYDRGEGFDPVRCPWFHGKLSREDCILKMQTYGKNCFLIRESTARENELTLSLKYNNDIHHFMIKRGVDKNGVGWIEVDGTFKQFVAVVDMVEFYKHTSLRSGVEYLLTIPCPRFTEMT